MARTLFALLFWDIMFANISGALETPFQDAPLDLCEDMFYYAQKDNTSTRASDDVRMQSRMDMSTGLVTVDHGFNFVTEEHGVGVSA